MSPDVCSPDVTGVARFGTAMTVITRRQEEA